MSARCSPSTVTPPRSAPGTEGHAFRLDGSIAYEVIEPDGAVHEYDADGNRLSTVYRDAGQVDFRIGLSGTEEQHHERRLPDGRVRRTTLYGLGWNGRPPTVRILPRAPLTLSRPHARPRCSHRRTASTLGGDSSANAPPDPDPEPHPQLPGRAREPGRMQLQRAHQEAAAVLEGRVR
jgi:hypothetical protein